MKDKEDSKANSRTSTGLAGRAERLGQTCEIGAVLLIAGSVVILVMRQSFPWILLSIATLLIGCVLIYLAIALASRSRDEGQRAAEGIRYAITERRIRTLRIVKAPRDAIEALETMQKDPEVIDQQRLLSEKDLVRRLVNELGSERASEVKEIVLKYTKAHQTDLRDVPEPPTAVMRAAAS